MQEQFLNQLEIEIDSILRLLNASDKKTFQLGLKMLDCSFIDLIKFFGTSFNITDDSAKVSTIINHPELDNKLNQLVNNKTIDKALLLKFYEVVRKIIALFLINLQTNDNEQYEKLATIHRENTFLVDEAFQIRNLKLKTNVSPNHNFNFIGQPYQLYNLYNILKATGFLNSSWEDFQMIFSLSKRTLKKNKINWLGSFLELNFVIKSLMERKLISNSANYKMIIVDCFMVKGKDISYNQVRNPHSSKRRFIQIEDFIIESCIKTRKNKISVKKEITIGLSHNGLGN